MSLPSEDDLYYSKELNGQVFEPGTGDVYIDVHRERIRAHNKHDAGGDSMEREWWKAGDRWLSVIGEEYGEVCRVLCEVRHGSINDAEYPIKLREELVQLAAMTTAWVAAIDRSENID